MLGDRPGDATHRPYALRLGARRAAAAAGVQCPRVPGTGYFMTSMRPADGLRTDDGRTIWSRLWLLGPRNRPSESRPGVLAEDELENVRPRICAAGVAAPDAGGDSAAVDAVGDMKHDLGEDGSASSCPCVASFRRNSTNRFENDCGVSFGLGRLEAGNGNRPLD